MSGTITLGQFTAIGDYRRPKLPPGRWQLFYARPFKRLQQFIEIRPQRLLVLPVSSFDFLGGSWGAYGDLRDSQKVSRVEGSIS
jgi:hypothetical protein